MPDGVVILYLLNPYGRSMTLGWIQNLTEMNTGDTYLEVKAAGT